MPFKPEKLRLGLVALAVLLSVAIAGSFLYGRWRERHMTQDIPAPLGPKIKQSTKSFTLSKTEHGRTLFTLHAERALEFRSDGHFALHGVEIDLYNRESGQADSISGKSFEYDPHTQRIEAKGKAQIVLHLPPSGERDQTQQSGPGETVRVTTYDLTFDRNAGIATSKGDVDFQMGDWSGHALGAQYDSRHGTLELSSQVAIAGHPASGPAVELNAASAVYQRNRNTIELQRPRYRAATRKGSERAEAEEATLLLRANGSAERLLAKNHVQLDTSGGIAVRAQQLRVLFGEKDRLHQAFLSGGVTYTNKQARGNGSGSANQALVAFNNQGVAQRIVLDGNVQTRRQTVSTNGSTLRAVAADHLALNLAALHGAHPRLHSAEAKGDVILTSESKASGKSLQKTTVAAQTLTASFGATGDLRQVNGSGNTRLETRAADGAIDSSSGDTLQVLFEHPRVAAGHREAASKQKNAAEATIRSAVQIGHVVLRQAPAPAQGSGAEGDSTATAKRADYTAADNTLTLTGHPRFHNARIELSASRLAFDRASGKATATGSVQTTLLPSPDSNGAESAAGGLLSGSEPVHLIADRAVLWRNTRQAVFSGDARLWRGADAIQAPGIEISGNMRILKANGAKNCRNCVVATLAEQPTAPSPARRENAEKFYPSVFRILSQSLLYSDAERKAGFQGQVQVAATDGKLTADRVDFFLANGRSISAVNGQKHGPAAVSAMPAGVQKFVASGHVRLLQPGRTATGNRLIYTAANRRFTLTGDTASPPEIADASQGTVTGQKLTFDAQRRAIMVTGAPGRRTAAHTRVRTP